MIQNNIAMNYNHPDESDMLKQCIGDKYRLVIKGEWKEGIWEDVYKRQEQRFSLYTESQYDKQGTGTGRRQLGHLRIAGPVSYTHLDVYKRQVTTRASPSMSLPRMKRNTPRWLRLLTG